MRFLLDHQFHCFLDPSVSTCFNEELFEHKLELCYPVVEVSNHESSLKVAWCLTTRFLSNMNSPRMSSILIDQLNEGGLE